MSITISDFKIMSLGNLNSYIYIVNSWPLLSLQEEIKLIDKCYYLNDFDSVDNLILLHLRFVVFIAKNYSGCGISQDDLIQEGNIGLMKAIKKFNPFLGVRLISFAVYWIKAEINDYILKNCSIVKMATTKNQKKIYYYLKKNVKNKSVFSTFEINMISRKLNVSIKDIYEMKHRMFSKDIYFNFSLDNDLLKYKYFIDNFYLYEQKSYFSVNYEESRYKENILNKLKIAINYLDNRSKYIIYSRWLNVDKKFTLKELANYFGISSERVRQLEKNAMKKLRFVVESI